MSASQRGPSRTAFCHRRPPGPRPPPHSCKAGTGPRHVAASLEPRQAGPGQTGRRPGADGFPEAQMVVGGSGDCPPDWWSVQAERMSPGSSHGSSRGVSSSRQESPPGRCVPGEGAWGIGSLWLCPEIALGPGPGHPTRAALFSHRSVCVGLWKCRAGNNALPGHPRESRGPAQLHLGARSVYLPLDPTAGPAPTTFLWGMFPARPPCTGAACGRGMRLCSLLAPVSEHLGGPQTHLGPLPPSTWAQEKQVTHVLPQVMQPASETQPGSGLPGMEPRLSTQPPGDSARGTLTGSPLLGLQVVKK